MTATGIAASELAILYDFNTSQTRAYGTNPMKNIGGIYGLMAGDGNSDGGVDALDKNLSWRPNNGTPWDYTKLADFNLDGGIDALDINLQWRPNNGSASQVPEAPAPTRPYVEPTPIILPAADNNRATNRRIAPRGKNAKDRNATSKQAIQQEEPKKANENYKRSKSKRPEKKVLKKNNGREN